MACAAAGQPNKKIRIFKGPGKVGFEEQYHDARAGVAPKPVPESALDALAQEYGPILDLDLASGVKSPMTGDSRKRGLAHACAVQLDRDVRVGELLPDINEAGFPAISRSFDDRTAAADTDMKALRAMYQWALEDAWCAQKPSKSSAASSNATKIGAVLSLGQVWMCRRSSVNTALARWRVCGCCFKTRRGAGSATHPIWALTTSF